MNNRLRLLATRRASRLQRSLYISAALCAGTMTFFEPRAGASTPDLLVNDYFHSGDILRFDGTTGAFAGIAAAPPAGDQFAGIGFQYGLDGNLYVAGDHRTDAGISGAVFRYSGQTGAYLGMLFSDPNLLQSNQGLAIQGNNLFVGNWSNNNVLEYNATTGASEGVFISAGAGGLNDPAFLRFGPDGNLYVSSGASKGVLEYNGATGAFLRAIATDLQGPQELQFGANGNLYVADPGFSNTVREYEGMTGNFVATIVSAHQGGIDFPTGFAINNGNIFTSARNYGGIYSYSAIDGTSNGEFTDGGGAFLGDSQDIELSAIPVPEPSGLSAVVIGSAILARRSRR